MPGAWLLESSYGEAKTGSLELRERQKKGRERRAT